MLNMHLLALTLICLGRWFTVSPSIRNPETQELQVLLDASRCAKLSQKSTAMVRVYVTAGKKLKAMDKGGTSDPFVVATLGGKKLGDGKSKIVHKKCKGDVYFGQVFEFERPLPGLSELSLAVYDWDLIGKNELIGETLVDLDDRYYSDQWQALGQAPDHPCRKPTEWRTLTVPGS
eukprot:SAG11_NODE_16179_length_555_cov_0.793860_1_plen_175_part_10